LSGAANLVDGDTNGRHDLFVRNVVDGTTTRVGLANDGAQPDADIREGFSITEDGRSVLFESWASNLVYGDVDGDVDVFQRDLISRVTTRITPAYEEIPLRYPQISPDGRHVAFVASRARSDDQIVVLDLATRDTTTVDLAGDGTPGNDFSRAASFSTDGSAIAFESFASNLVDGDTNGARDVFMRGLG